ncbi:hypothetical protein MMC32_006603 [Xylographa parallela]|nr:hypothetical protein [Xylographa parallela]
MCSALLWERQESILILKKLFDNTTVHSGTIEPAFKSGRSDRVWISGDTILNTGSLRDLANGPGFQIPTRVVEDESETPVEQQEFQTERLPPVHLRYSTDNEYPDRYRHYEDGWTVHSFTVDPEQAVSQHFSGITSESEDKIDTGNVFTKLKTPEVWDLVFQEGCRMYGVDIEN